MTTAEAAIIAAIESLGERVLPRSDTLPTTWTSGPLRMLDGILVWCAGAGIAGAMLPRELADIAPWAGLREEHLSDLGRERMRAVVPRVVAEAQRRCIALTEISEWSTDPLPPILPRGAAWEVDGGRVHLVWHTSVRLALCLSTGEVTLAGAHPDRQGACESALRERTP